MTSLSEQIVHYRAKHNLSQAKFAERCRVNVMTINAVERGLKKPSTLTEAKIRMVLEEEKEQ